jgi:hypothetical protein
MRWVSLRSSAFFVCGILTGTLLGSTAVPLWKTALISRYSEQFGELTFACDNSMRLHLLASQRLQFEPSKANVESLRQAEVALIDCQEYDLFQKRLIRWGLDENDVSEMALLAIEANASDLKQVVSVHEIRY